jgi:hypothetical protein
MNKTSILLILFFLTCNSAFSQADKAIELSKKIFKPGIVTAGLYYMDFPSDIKSLQEKSITNLNKSPEWKGRGIIKMITDGDLLVTYMDEMGLTKDEFHKMHEGFEKGKQRFVTDTIQMKITITNNVISFSGKGKLSVINPLSINLNNKSINYDCWTSTKEFPRMNGVIFSSGSEVHLDLILVIVHKTTKQSCTLC